MKGLRVVALIALLLGGACSDPNAPRIPSPQDDRRTPTRQPTRGIEGREGLALTELPGLA